MVLSTAPLRVLVAGTGSIGRRHIGNLLQLCPGAQLGLLRDGARRDDYADGLSAVVFATLDEALAWAPQMAIVATPSDRHHEIVAPLLRAGVACFLEKPVVIQADAAQELQTLAACGQLPPTQVGCVLRFLPSLRQVKSWLQCGAVGTVVRASFEVGQWLPDWRPSQDYRQSYSSDPARGGGVVLDLIHELDLACWLFEQPELLGAWGAQRSALDIASEDVALLALRSADGALLSVQLDYVARRPLRRLQIIGDAGTITWDLPQRLCRLERPGEAVSEASGFDVTQTYLDALGELILAIEGKQATSLPLQEGLRATTLAIAANRLIRSHTPS